MFVFVPVLVKEKTMEATGIISSIVATRPKAVRVFSSVHASVRGTARYAPIPNRSPRLVECT